VANKHAATNSDIRTEDFESIMDRSARSRSIGEYLLFAFIAPSSQEMAPPANLDRFSPLLYRLNYLGLECGSAYEKQMALTGWVSTGTG
jgi:hypothetical protein